MGHFSHRHNDLQAVDWFQSATCIKMNLETRVLLFTFSTDEYSASIGHIYLTLPTTFSVYPEGYRIDTQQLVTYTNILTTFGYVSVSNLQNLGVYDTTLSMSSRSVRLTVFVQTYKTSLTIAKFEAKISPTGKNSTVNSCESQVVRYEGNYLAGRNFLTIKDTPLLDEAEKLRIFNIELTIKPKTSAYYFLYSHIYDRRNMELCSVDYMLQDGNITRKVRLISDYLVDFGNRYGATTPLGVFQNKNTSTVTYNFQCGVKLIDEANFDSVRLTFRLMIDEGFINTVNLNLSMLSPMKTLSTIPPSKVPTITIKKVEPQNSQPIVNYSTVVEVRVKFVDDFVYLPVVFLLQVNTSEAKIIRQKIQTIGYLLKTVAPVAYSFPVTDNSAQLNIPSVYLNETCSDGQCDMAIRYSIIPISTKQFVITSTVTCGSVNYINTLNMIPQSNYSNQPSLVTANINILLYRSNRDLSVIDLQNYMKVDYGPVCTININDYVTGRLYFGAAYAAIFKLKYNPSTHKSVAKFPVLAEVVCKPYERSISVATGCSRPKFYRFIARLYAELDYTYMGPYVEQIIAYTIPHNVLFGMGSNGGSVVISKDFGNTWMAINPFVFHKTLNTLTKIITSSVLPWISLTGPVDNALMDSFCTFQVAGQWKRK
ncbi:hypothetical protein MN116_009035 [Schistosoma mekongi]|uniref:Uncharacterized protein n=1 Tax=Schistosoma mekongi TaxID=38744 RepID=A0AAE2D1V9_SCHME|nr:hypothetical protein MN116_009035 [Schistosoma mekongi]